MEFWNGQNFDLQLPNDNGVTIGGNCDLCHLKSTAKLMTLIEMNPSLADWWIEKEAESKAEKPSGRVFRLNRPSYAEMARIVKEKGAPPIKSTDPEDGGADCFCNEDQA